MKEKDFHKIIRETGSNDNDVLYKALAQRHPEIKPQANASDGKPPKKFNARFLVAVCASVAAVVSVAILAPALLLNNGDVSDNDAHNTPSRKYAEAQLFCTVAEYNEINNTGFLFFDWDNVTDYRLIEYSHISTEAFLGLSVSFVNSDTSDSIEYAVFKEKEPLNFVENHLKICTKESAVSGRSVKWTTVNNNAYGIFNYSDYDYYVTLKNNPDETRLFELIQTMLQGR